MMNNLFAVESPLLKRPGTSTFNNLYVTDSFVKKNIDELNQLLGKSIFYEKKAAPKPASGSTAEAKKASGDANNGNLSHWKKSRMEEISERYYLSYKDKDTRQQKEVSLKELLDLSLTPKKSSIANDKWDDNSQIEFFYKGLDNKGKDNKLSLAHIIDREPELSKMRADIHEYSKKISGIFNKPDYRVILRNKEIMDYLTVYAFCQADIEEVNGFIHFLENNSYGARIFREYLNVSAARDYISSKKLFIEGITHNEPTGKEIPLISEIRNELFSYNSSGFIKDIDKKIQKYVLADREYEIINYVIDKTGITITPEVMPLVVKYLQQNPFITKDQATYLLPTTVMQLHGAPQNLGQITSDEDVGMFDYSVKIYSDSSAVQDISKSNVMCAAQLFYVMVLGDELGVFDAVNFLTENYITSGQVEIHNRQLLNDLQLYVFSEQFRNLKDNKTYQRTEPPQRVQFYKQVFNHGNVETGEGFLVNQNFEYIWGSLMREVYNYLQKISDGYINQISNQNIAQAVEDLQYNLSSSCTGMVKVVSPFINSELDFVIERILSNPEIISQIAPVRGSFWSVLEKILGQLRGSVPNRNAILDKAQYGYEIIKFTAEYNDNTFSDQDKFGELISLVEAYALAESELQNKNKMRAPEMNGHSPMQPGSSLQDLPTGDENMNDWEF